ncbi:MAG: alpha-L-rhamnosidase, partial [Clostridia bacterium]|nr:alpha-L-rhamnosidase [Clostridia bacterium]
MQHKFIGKWISDSEFFILQPRNVFHKQLEKVSLPCDEHRNRHSLFRKKYEIAKAFDNAVIFISADDYYKLYINGRFAAQGPSP